MYMEKLSVRFFLRPPLSAVFFLLALFFGGIVERWWWVVVCCCVFGWGSGATCTVVLMRSGAQQRACMREIESRLQATAKSMGASLVADVDADARYSIFFPANEPCRNLYHQWCMPGLYARERLCRVLLAPAHPQPPW